MDQRREQSSSPLRRFTTARCTLKRMSRRGYPRYASPSPLFLTKGTSMLPPESVLRTCCPVRSHQPCTASFVGCLRRVSSHGWPSEGSPTLDGDVWSDPNQPGLLRPLPSPLPEASAAVKPSERSEAIRIDYQYFVRRPCLRRRDRGCS